MDVEFSFDPCCEHLVVETSGGKVVGGRADGVLTWKGIPYGRAQRWRRPRPVSWEGEWDATRYGPVAPQTTYTWKDQVIGDEECLNLDIVRPATSDRLPVVVYFHGGGYFAGASHTAVLRGYSFARELDVVYVGLNFRLGALGYVDLTSVGSRGGFEELEPNPAMRDQILALRWVRENIESFGGDPDRVCLMGESAGGAAIASLMTVPSVKGLFHRAILQSAPVMNVHSARQSELWARRFVQYVGFRPRTVQVSDLLKVPTGEVVRAGQHMLWQGRGMWELNACFGNSIDGDVLPEHPIDCFGAGAQAAVPLLIGTNSDELSVAHMLFLTRRARAATARKMLEAYDPEGADQVLAAYGGAGSRREFSELLTDAVFWSQSVRLAELHSQLSGVGTWMYRFDYAPAALRRLGIGAMHSMELAALFGDARASKARLLLGAELDQVTHLMQAAWRNFIWDSDPGWAEYRTPDRVTRIFERELRTVRDPRSEFREAWSNFHMHGWNGLESAVSLPRPGR